MNWPLTIGVTGITEMIIGTAVNTAVSVNAAKSMPGMNIVDRVTTWWRDQSMYLRQSSTHRQCSQASISLFQSRCRNVVARSPIMITKNLLALSLAAVLGLGVMPAAYADFDHPVSHDSQKVHHDTKQDSATKIAASPARSTFGMLIVCLIASR